MKYKKQSINGYKVLNMYPVYIKDVYGGREPFKVVGIRETQVELEGDFSGSTHNVCQKDWFDDDKVFVVKTVCEEQLKPNGCQVHNVNCCGGGSVINKHVSYWNNLICSECGNDKHAFNTVLNKKCCSKCRSFL